MDMKSNSGMEQGQSPSDAAAIPSISAAGPPPICRQFWKAGSYNAGASSKVDIRNNKNHLHVHPMFLHSNATSHKWAFGAVAELLDNAVDEIENGATFVVVDKISNPRDGCSALLVQDDGGGMDPEAMRCCMSFGYSDKKSNSSIGHYGNGFKTSSMRLGADVIVFSRHEKNRSVTRSVGLLSYTFLTATGLNRIVVPMVDYKYNPSTKAFETLHEREHFMSNLSILLQWSPFSSEYALLEQFNDMGSHGTKIIIYNLWLNNDGDLELDFDSDPRDIRIGGDTKLITSRSKSENQNHIANQYQFSLRVYLSILYLKIPETFRIFLRGQVVEHHNVVDDLKYTQYILYRPQCGGTVEGSIVTTIGFLKEAPRPNIHGFCVYHKNRLILPYWPVVNYSDSRGRGVVGALQANFIEPTHNKQDFERTSLFQKLEVRLKEMTWEYWDFHCTLIGHQPKKKPRTTVPCPLLSDTGKGGAQQPRVLDKSFTDFGGSEHGSSFMRTEQLMSNSSGRSFEGYLKRKEQFDFAEANTVKRQAGNFGDVIPQPVIYTSSSPKDQEAMTLMQENNRLLTRCVEYEKNEEDLNLKVLQLQNEIEEVNQEYVRLLAELSSEDGLGGKSAGTEVKNEKSWPRLR